METLSWSTVDKSKWARGPWDGEPDKIQWPDAETGLPCLIVRNPAGALCGYVGVSEEHPFFGLPYNDPGDELQVHGGLTFSDFCADTKDHSQHICHLPGPGEPDRVWWLGFDCAHGGDVSPGYKTGAADLFNRGAYRTLEYVRAECASLAKQIKAAA